MITCRKHTYTFEDVLLVPRYSTATPSEIETNCKLGDLDLKVPFLSAAMDTVTNGKLALELSKLGGLGILHRNQTIEQQVEEASFVVSNGGQVGAAVGTTPDKDVERAEALYNVGVRVFVIDTAHGHSKRVIEQVKKLCRLPKAFIIAGNVVTREGADALVKAGAHAVKIGIGGSSICSTRLVAGVGIPQFSAILEVAQSEEVRKNNIPLIADGGIKASDDVVKALAAGASLVMMGGCFAKAQEAPGEVIEKNGPFGEIISMVKVFRGMGSKEVLKENADRYGQSGFSKPKPEGVTKYVEVTGSLEEIVEDLGNGLRIGMGYLGAETLKDLWDCEYVTTTSASQRESKV